MKNPADDDIIQIGTNVLKNQQKGKLKTKTKNLAPSNCDNIVKRDLIQLVLSINDDFVLKSLLYYAKTLTKHV